MATISLLVIPFLLISRISLASAIPNVTAVQIGQGSCSGFPSSFNTNGNNADAFIFVPDQADNSSINGLHTGIVGTSLVVYEKSTVASSIFLCDRTNVQDGFGMQNLLLSTNSSDDELGYWSQGNKPETYVHEVNGVKQDGVFVGNANVTTWAFRRAAADSDYYQIRLLVPGIVDPNGGNLYNGEFKGFLKVVPPVPLS